MNDKFWSSHISKSKFSGDIIKLFQGRFLSMFFALLVPVVLVRTLSLVDFGLYSIFILLVQFFHTSLEFGFTKSLFFNISSDKSNEPKYVFNVLYIFMFLSLIGSLILFFLSNVIAKYLGAEEIQNILPFCGLYLFFTLSSVILEPIFTISSEISESSQIYIISEIIKSACILISAFYTQDIYYIVISLIIFSILRFVYLLFILRNRYGIFGFDKKLFNSQLRYSYPLGLSTVCGTLSKRIDRFLVTFFFGPAYYAFYAVGNHQIPFINTLLVSTGEVTIPKAVDLLSRGRIIAFMDMWKSLLHSSIFLGILLLGLFQVFAEEFIFLIFTEKYEPAIPIFRVVIFQVIGSVLFYGIILRSIGATKEILLSNIIMFFYSLPLCYILILNYGIIGAAYSTLFAFSLNVFAQLIFSSKKLNVNFTEILPVFYLFQLLTISMFCFYVTYLIIYHPHLMHILLHFGDSNLKHLIFLFLKSLIFGTLYFFFNYYLKIHDFRENIFLMPYLSRFTLFARESKN